MSAVTVAMLVYRNPEWLDFALEGLSRARNLTPTRVMVVGCDAVPDVVGTGRLDIDHRSDDPDEYYINRVYRAWNRAVREAETGLVVLINSDMYVSDYWLDALVETYHSYPKAVPCSLLVESGRIDSAMPEHVRDFGRTPREFSRAAWRKHAADIRSPYKVEPGRLYMPVLLERDTFLAAGGYPLGNPGGVSGDRVAFGQLGVLGYTHITSLGSVVYHVQEGEMRDRAC